MEKPLHVCVAEALGWTETRLGPLLWPAKSVEQAWAGIGPDSVESQWPMRAIPEYDTDWAATGPLIERLLAAQPFASVTVCPPDPDEDDIPEERFEAWFRLIADSPKDSVNIFGHGATPLAAICSLILAVHAAGKLHLGPRVDVPATMTGERIE